MIILVSCICFVRACVRACTCMLEVIQPDYNYQNLFFQSRSTVQSLNNRMQVREAILSSKLRFSDPNRDIWVISFRCFFLVFFGICKKHFRGTELREDRITATIRKSRHFVKHNYSSLFLLSTSCLSFVILTDIPRAICNVNNVCQARTRHGTQVVLFTTKKHQ